VLATAVGHPRASDTDGGDPHTCVSAPSIQREKCDRRLFAGPPLDTPCTTLAGPATVRIST